MYWISFLKATSVAAVLSLLTACAGGNSSSSPSPPAVNHLPTISSLTYSPTRGASTAQSNIVLVSGSFIYNDPDGINDLASVVLSYPGTSDYLIPKSAMLLSGDKVSISLYITMGGIGTVTFNVHALDSANNSSNSLSGTFEVGSSMAGRDFTWSQSNDKSNLTISTVPNILPSCSIFTTGTYLINSITYDPNHLCGPIAFNATSPLGASTNWTTMLSHVWLCGSDPNDNIYRNPINVTVQPMWNFVDPITTSSYSLTFKPDGTGIMEGITFCK